MKPAPFGYTLAKSIDEAVAMLEEGDGEAMIIAGGQTLMPMLALRMARPESVVDINGIEELVGIEDGNGEVVIKACTRQTAALESPIVAERLPLLAKAIAFVGHQQTRNRGTVGGSLSLGDPASEIPLATLALDGHVTLRSVNGSRIVPIGEFFVGPMMTACEGNELMVSIHFPCWPDGERIGTSFHEVNERHGDFAIVAVAAQIHLDANGICTRAAVAIGGAHDRPLRIPGLEAKLVSNKIDKKIIQSALTEISMAIEPFDDQHASADYRQHTAQVLAERALTDAVADASGVQQ
ncbi:MAG: xanthine dehydrogenase family protein subunit M [Rhodospirillales bacterium]|nr:xanthine dehydrogenase family protein subunit M [Rhodospirillales bacterium]